MSAYIVERNHIRFLVASALYVAGRHHHGDSFRWWHEGHHELRLDNATEVGQMLWDECRASVSYRYPSDDRDDLPGPVNADLVYFHVDPGPRLFQPDLVLDDRCFRGHSFSRRFSEHFYQECFRI